MKFFIPFAENEEHEKSVYEAIQKFLSQGLGAVFTDQKILSVDYSHDGKEYHAEVGQPHELNNELVFAILYDQAFSIYHVCTPNRGVARGMSILVGKHSVRKVVNFD